MNGNSDRFADLYGATEAFFQEFTRFIMLMEQGGGELTPQQRREARKYIAVSQARMSQVFRMLRGLRRRRVLSDGERRIAGLAVQP